MVKLMRDYLSDRIFDIKADNESLRAKWVRYYVELSLVSIIKFLEILIASVIFNVVLDTLIIYFSFGLVRIQARGWHATQSWLCSLQSLIFFVALPVITKGLGVGLIVKIGLILCGFFAMIRCAPQETNKNPINNSKEKKFRKFLAVLFILVLGMSQFLPLEILSKNISIAIGIQIFVVLPITKKLMEGRYLENEKIEAIFSKHDDEKS